MLQKLGQALVVWTILAWSKVTWPLQDSAVWQHFSFKLSHKLRLMECLHHSLLELILTWSYFYIARAQTGRCCLVTGRHLFLITLCLHLGLFSPQFLKTPLQRLVNWNVFNECKDWLISCTCSHEKSWMSNDLEYIVDVHCIKARKMLA